MRTSIIGLVGICIILMAKNLSSQDSLTSAQLDTLTFSFDITKGRLTGQGAEFLKKEMSEAQFTMLGEYHGSARISEFTAALIPELDELDYKTLVLEVGPITGELLDDKVIATEEQLKTLNQKYAYIEEDGYVNPPIPFFTHVEDAHFLSLAKKHNWKVMGIDQEFFDSYLMLLDEMYQRLSSPQKAKYKDSYLVAKDSLKRYYDMEYLDGIPLTKSLQNSDFLKNFFSEMKLVPAAAELVTALNASVDIYAFHDNRKWYENNSTRVNYMKAQLRSQLSNNDFDVSKDKLLIKMGNVHLSRGVSPLDLNEVGNTLYELAAFNGNKTLGISFSQRFYLEDGEIKDRHQSTNQYIHQMKDLTNQGQKNEWVVIDLRPLIKGHFFSPIKYHFNEYIEKLVLRYDLLVIPKTEKPATPNY